LLCGFPVRVRSERVCAVFLEHDRVLDLIATRRPYTVIGHADQTSWLFPGQRPGQHISADRLGQRLIAVGIQPGQARSTALFALAEEVPAAILARMLGIHIQVAVQWQKASAGDWAAYAADVSRRTGDGTATPRRTWTPCLNHGRRSR
jgi:hypothetical protein